MKIFLFTTMLSALTCPAFANNQPARLIEIQTKVLQMIAKSTDTPAAGESLMALLGKIIHASSTYTTPDKLQYAANLAVIKLEDNQQLTPLEALEQHINTADSGAASAKILANLLQNEEEMSKQLLMIMFDEEIGEFQPMTR